METQNSSIGKRSWVKCPHCGMLNDAQKIVCGGCELPLKGGKKVRPNNHHDEKPIHEGINF